MIRFCRLLSKLLVLTGLLLGVSLAPRAHAEADDVTLSATVQEYLTFSITNKTVAFSNLTPNTPACYDTGSIAAVTTNAANGYTLGLHDNVAAASALLHSDTATRIDDFSGTIATPLSWASEPPTNFYGLGVGLYLADNNKDAKWGTGTTVCSTDNKYAGAPQNTTVAHTVTGYRSGEDTSSWSWKVNVPPTQKTGEYSGVVTFTATAVLS